MPDFPQPKPSGANRPTTPRRRRPSLRRPGGGIHLGTVAGIKIGLDYSWFVIFGLVLLSMGLGYLPSELPNTSILIIWMLALLTTILFFASVLGHELAHSVLARINGLPIEGIDLFILGGIAKLQEEPHSARQEFIIAVVGPLTSFVIGALFAVLWIALRPISSPLAVVAEYVAQINVLLGAFNLLPGFPMDGGRVLRAIIWSRTGSLRRATQVATSVGQFFGYALIILGLVELFVTQSLSGIWLVFIGWFILQAAQASYQQLLMRQSIAGVKVREILSTTPPIIPASISVHDAIDHYFMEYPASIFPVMHGGQLLGVVGVEELRGVDYSARAITPVAQVVRTVAEDHFVSPDDDAATALEKISRQGGGLLIVMAGENFAGIITQQDLLRLVQLRLQLGR